MARPSKVTPEKWAEARALYGADKSFREIEKLTGIDNSNLAKKAKTEKWERGVLPQLIADTVRVKESFTALLPQQQAVVTAEVNERLKHIEFFNRAALKNVSVSVKKISDDTTQMEHKLIAETILKGMYAVLGKTPDTIINTQVNSASKQPVFMTRVVSPVDN